MVKKNVFEDINLLNRFGEIKEIQIYVLSPLTFKLEMPDVI